MKEPDFQDKKTEHDEWYYFDSKGIIKNEFKTGYQYNH